MAHKFNFKSYTFILFFTHFLLCFGQEYGVTLETFKELSDVNQKWLKKTGIPEVARLLQLPPYSYHSAVSSPDLSFSSEYLNVPNGTFTWNKVVKQIEGKCSDDLIQVIENVKSPWALQMLDSEGKLSSGILRGGLIWTGHYSECLDVYAPLDKDGHGDFHGQYCTSSWTLNIGGKYSSVPLIVGLCVPDSCTAEHLKVAMKNLSHIIDRFPVLKKLDSVATLNSIICKAKQKSIDAPGIIYLIIFFFLIFLVIIGSSLTLYDNWQPKNKKRGFLHNTQPQDYGTLPAQNHCINSEIATSKVQTSSTFENEASPLNKSISGTTTEPGHQEVIPPAKPVSAVKRIFLCFSVFTNGERILNTENVGGQLLSIHGIRFLSLTWVILGHTYISAISIIGNRLDVLKDIDTFAFQMLLQSPFSVDSFFLLSGFLLSYLFMREMTKRKGKISWLYFYIHRLWRLTPAFIIAVFFYMLVFNYLGSGPFWNNNQCDENRNSWWKYFLYINNFIPIHKMCLGWSWYLANDMQFYVISPIFLYPLWKWPKAGFGILGTFLLATWITTGVMSYHYDLIPMFVGATQTKNFSAYEAKMWDSFDLIYDKPYTRIAPYIIGVILGYFLHQNAGRKNFLNWWQQLLGWMIAAFCSLSVVFGLFHVDMGRTLSLFYNALCRSSYSIGLAWLIYACETGHGGFLTKLLSWKVFVPLSRLTYCTYLIHPMIIHGYYQSYQTAIYFTNFFAVTNFLGFLLMSYIVGFLYSLAFESPFMNLEKLIMKQKTV